jgi:hypothetical protein
MVKRVNQPRPADWDLLEKEIGDLLLNALPTYRKKIYLTPGFYIEGIKTHPEKYPRLASRSVMLQTRYISLFLKDQGREKREGSKQNAHVWVLPGYQ